MSPLDRLHPDLAHHIVNSMGFQNLRPLQEQALEALHDGSHGLLIAPTAAGKTEAALFPLLSRMLSERWTGLSILYVCPIKALLNNLEVRLARLLGLLGRRARLWHGDVGPTERRELMQDPPDLLLTTPESIEVILSTKRGEGVRFFGSIRAVVVDEIHAFAGDDRGWHLLAVLERVSRGLDAPPQRVGLSATVGNPDELLAWFTAGVPGSRRVVSPVEVSPAHAEVTLDFVGTLGNAAHMIKQLHPGEKRLVFVDSRSGVEELATALRDANVNTFVSHSSLAVAERRRAEAAFAEGNNCVIVATSTLELGIDVGDLDRVIQIESPYSVSSFLQRMGRTGRRRGTNRNTLFLTLREEGLIRAAALLLLWGEGGVEPIVPPPVPYHVLVQQSLLLALESGAIDAGTPGRILPGLIPSAGVTPQDVAQILASLVATGYLLSDSNLHSLGPGAEREYGSKNYLDLFSVFSTAPMFLVLHGRVEVGQVQPLAVLCRTDEPQVILLGGRAWQIRSVDYVRGRVQVEPSGVPGRTRWTGGVRLTNPYLARAMKRILLGHDPPGTQTRRAQQKLGEIRQDHSFICAEGTTLVQGAEGNLEWWTFGGLAANLSIRDGLGPLAHPKQRPSGLMIPLAEGVSEQHLDDFRRSEGRIPAEPSGHDLRAVRDMVKFSEVLPDRLLRTLFEARFRDAAGARSVMQEPMTRVGN